MLAPSCLSCPLPQCVHDLPGGIPTLRRIVREIEIKQRRADGETLAEIAGTVGISVRTVTRLLGERGAIAS